MRTAAMSMHTEIPAITVESLKQGETARNGGQALFAFPYFL